MVRSKSEGARRAGGVYIRGPHIPAALARALRTRGAQMTCEGAVIGHLARECLL